MEWLARWSSWQTSPRKCSLSLTMRTRWRTWDWCPQLCWWWQNNYKLTLRYSLQSVNSDTTQTLQWNKSLILIFKPSVKIQDNPVALRNKIQESCFWNWSKLICPKAWSLLLLAFNVMPLNPKIGMWRVYFVFKINMFCKVVLDDERWISQIWTCFADLNTFTTIQISNLIKWTLPVSCHESSFRSSSGGSFTLPTFVLAE